ASRAMTLAGACFSKRARIASHIVLPSRLIIGRVYANTLKGLTLRAGVESCNRAVSQMKRRRRIFSGLAVGKHRDLPIHHQLQEEHSS
ncbi:hypothetical protein, partial [Azotobacter chroococcum]|uniref:hypothetical protein n=1 Tax=Azotobacter chroococcum TaxID=353 RepID=UPI001B8C8CFC